MNTESGMKVLSKVSRKWLRKKNKKIVFTNGCFDVLHVGHIHILRESSELGDYLIVGLNSDASVKRIKGDSRPINNQEDRAEILRSLKFVDEVIIFDEDTPENLIKNLNPQILTKGGDYEKNSIVGADYVQSIGGEVRIIPSLPNKSSSSIIQKIAMNLRKI
jgi:D-beta-D-heptose 7-phosphate kinase/D-beta-D-heptose 1-phosphate adenosyltransferase